MTVNRSSILRVSIVASILLGVLALLFVESWSEPDIAEEVIEGPDELTRHKETFRSGIRAVQQSRGREAVIALRSFTFGPRPVEQYRLYYLANALQLDGDQRSARLALRTLLAGSPSLVLSESVAFSLAALHESQGDTRNAVHIYQDLAASAGTSAVRSTVNNALVRSAFYAGDLGALLAASRDLLTGASTTTAGERASQFASSIRPDGSPLLTPDDRLIRLRGLATEAPERTLEEIASITLVTGSDPARELALIGAIASQELERYEDSEASLQTLLERPDPEIEELTLSALNHLQISYRLDDEQYKTRRRRVRAGVKKIVRRGPIVDIQRYEWVTTRSKVTNREKEAQRQGHLDQALGRLRSLLRLPLDDREKERALLDLYRVALEKEDEQLERQAIGAIRALSPNTQIGLQRMWDRAWESYSKDDRSTAIDRLDFIRKTYSRPDIRRQADYWIARSLEKKGESIGANLIYDSLVEAPYEDLYAHFARERGGRRGVSEAGVRITPNDQKWSEIVEREMPSELVLAWELNVLGARADALAEVRANLTAQNQTWSQAILAEYFLSQGSRDLALRSMRRAFPQLATVEQDSVPRHFLELYYPLQYYGLIQQFAERRDLDPFLVMALVHQESSFDPEVESRAGAVGLMQLMPATGRELGRRVFGTFQTARLIEPEINVNLGTLYLRDLIEMMDGSVELAIAGYNGGPSRIRRWRQHSDLPLDEFLEGLALSETRNYVKRVTILRSSYEKLFPQLSQNHP